MGSLLTTMFYKRIDDDNSLKLYFDIFD